MHERVRAYVGERMPGLADARVVLAASGGADSSAMVALLVEAGIVDPSRALAAHFDHRLRSEDASGRDRACVERLCARYGLALEAGAWEQPRPTEAAAREARYAFLGEVARRSNAGFVVTGHTSDDQVETVLLHMLRGAGLYGVAAMAAVARTPDGAKTPLLARPLLAVSREETRAYCRAGGIDVSDDESNDDPRYLRNRLRRHLLPHVTRDERAHLLRLSDEARAATATIEAAVSPIVSRDGEAIGVDRPRLAELAPELRAYAWRVALVRLLGDAREFDRRHYATLARAHLAATGSQFQLPRGVVATVDPEAVLLSCGPLRLPAVPADIALSLPYAGDVGAWRIAVAFDDAGALRLPSDAVVRGRRPGDRIRPPGMRGHKKLQDYYVDRKVPRRERDAAPVIAAGAEVLWTPFGAAATAAGAPAAVSAERR